jgi:hypothetical protein
MMIASFRATATHAFFAPARLASFTPHARTVDHFLDLRRCEFAASKSACRKFVPALANVAGAINLTRLINARRQPEVCRHGL